MDQFPIVLRGYDKDKVDEAFAAAQERVRQAQRTLAGMREQIAAGDDRILQLQAQLEEEKKRKPANSSFASLGANAQQMLASAEQTSSELLERAKADASTTRKAAQAQAQTLINNAKLDAQHIIDDANQRASSTLDQANNEAETITTTARNDAAQLRAETAKNVTEQRQTVELELSNSREEHDKKLASERAAQERELSDLKATATAQIAAQRKSTNEELSRLKSEANDQIEAALAEANKKLADVMGDGGQWTMAMNVYKKYGAVPKDLYPETASSKNTGAMNTQLRHMLHTAVAHHVGEQVLNETGVRGLAGAHEGGHVLQEVVDALELVVVHGVVLGELELLDVQVLLRDEAGHVQGAEQPAAAGTVLVGGFAVVHDGGEAALQQARTVIVLRDGVDAGGSHRVHRHAVGAVIVEVLAQDGQRVVAQRLQFSHIRCSPLSPCERITTGTSLLAVAPCVGRTGDVPYRGHRPSENDGLPPPVRGTEGGRSLDMRVRSEIYRI